MATDKLATAELLFRTASRMGLKPVWLEQGALFAISTSGGERYLNYAKSSINSHLSSSIASNKLATRLVLDRHNLPGIPYLNPTNHTEADKFLAKHKKIIMKPLSGSNSKDVHIVESPSQLSAFDVRQYILEKYIAGRELRYQLLNNEVICVHESQYGESVAEDRKLVRISYPRAEWDPELVQTSLKVAKIFGLHYVAVDYIIDSDGRARILEINSSPDMKWLHAPTSGPAVDIAGLFLKAMLDDQKPKLDLPSGKPLGTHQARRIVRV